MPRLWSNALILLGGMLGSSGLWAAQAGAEIIGLLDGRQLVGVYDSAASSLVVHEHGATRIIHIDPDDIVWRAPAYDGRVPTSPGSGSSPSPRSASAAAPFKVPGRPRGAPEPGQKR